LKRRDHVEVKASALTEVERKLIRALAISDPENLDTRHLAAEAIAAKPHLFQHLGAFQALQELAARPTADPMEVVTDEAQRGLVAQALLHEVNPPPATEIAGAIQELEERANENRQRELRQLIVEAERRGDFAEVSVLMKQKIELDRALRELRTRKPDEP
jgi:DNA primase